MVVANQQTEGHLLEQCQVTATTETLNREAQGATGQQQQAAANTLSQDPPSPLTTHHFNSCPAATRQQDSLSLNDNTATLARPTNVATLWEHF